MVRDTSLDDPFRTSITPFSRAGDSSISKEGKDESRSCERTGWSCGPIQCIDTRWNVRTEVNNEGQFRFWKLVGNGVSGLCG